MSEVVSSPLSTDSATSSRRGQSFVEFALVLPMLIVLLMGLADLGRVFSAGITLEASARNAAEAAAQEYVQLARNKPGGVLDAADYTHLHDVAMDAVCSEGEAISNNTGGSCSIWASVCVHDGVDPDCGSEAAGAPKECQALTAPGSWDFDNLGAAPSGKPALAYVEVRACYRFLPIFGSVTLPFGSGITLGQIYLERDREFTVANY